MTTQEANDEELVTQLVPGMTQVEKILFRPTIANPSLQSIPLLLDKEGNETVFVWDLWRCISDGARRYLIARAENPFYSSKECCVEAGLSATAISLDQYRAQYPGFSDLEGRLRDEPWTAMHFLGVINLHAAMKYLRGVMDGREKGGKEQAARFLVNAASPKFRERVRPPEMPELPGQGSGVHFEKLMQMAEESLKDE